MVRILHVGTACNGGYIPTFRMNLLLYFFMTKKCVFFTEEGESSFLRSCSDCVPNVLCAVFQKNAEVTGNFYACVCDQTAKSSENYEYCTHMQPCLGFGK